MSRPSFHGDPWDRDDPELPPSLPGSPADVAILGDDPWEEVTEVEPSEEVTVVDILPVTSCP